MIQALIGPIANLAGTWFQNKIEKTKADGQAKVAEAKARATVAEKVATGQVEWEGKMADATVDSWKDEFALCVLLAPAILVFIPGTKTKIAGARRTHKANSSFQLSTVASAILPSHATSPAATFSATVARALDSATLACPSALVFSTLFSNQAPARFAMGPINAPSTCTPS